MLNVDSSCLVFQRRTYDMYVSKTLGDTRVKEREKSEKVAVKSIHPSIWGVSRSVAVSVHDFQSIDGISRLIRPSI